MQAPAESPSSNSTAEWSSSKEGDHPEPQTPRKEQSTVDWENKTSLCNLNSDSWAQSRRTETIRHKTEKTSNSRQRIAASRRCVMLEGGRRYSDSIEASRSCGREQRKDSRTQTEDSRQQNAESRQNTTNSTLQIADNSGGPLFGLKCRGELPC
jgi:hypothetical protein